MPIVTVGRNRRAPSARQLQAQKGTTPTVIWHPERGTTDIMGTGSNPSLGGDAAIKVRPEGPAYTGDAWYLNTGGNNYGWYWNTPCSQIVIIDPSFVGFFFSRGDYSGVGLWGTEARYDSGYAEQFTYMNDFATYGTGLTRKASGPIALGFQCVVGDKNRVFQYDGTYAESGVTGGSTYNSPGGDPYRKWTFGENASSDWGTHYAKGPVYGVMLWQAYLTVDEMQRRVREVQQMIDRG